MTCSRQENNDTNEDEQSGQESLDETGSSIQLSNKSLTVKIGRESWSI